MTHSEASPKREFFVELIKPSHYDDDGYVIQWKKALIPSNSLSSVYALAREASRNHALGEDVEITIRAYDETNRILPIDEISSRFKANGQHGLVCMVGVQSNQYPRALDISRQFRKHGVPVAIGGFHVSGCLSMLPELPDDLQQALDLGISLFAGEAEGRLEQVFADAASASLQPIYNFMKDLPGLEGQPTPFLPRGLVGRYSGSRSSFDAGRGCPFTCSFCTIINVQGRKSRFRTADDIENLIRENAAQGVTRFFVTDDNFARNKNWEAIFDRMIRLRENEFPKLSFMLQVDTLCHKIPNFVEKAARAGCKNVFIGLENINPDNLKAASKGQNRITEYRKMLQAWRNQGVLTYCGYILGFPDDTPESIERDIEIVKRELPVDVLEFFVLTPLPGSEDHQRLHNEGIWMDPDMNGYDLEHVNTGHPIMSRKELETIYRKAWDIYFSPEHIETLFRRSIASPVPTSKVMSMILWFYGAVRYENLHPLQCGAWRIKVRRQRRYGMPIENPLIFYPRRLYEMLTTYIPVYLFYRRLRKLKTRLQNEPGAKDYTDIAIAPVVDGEEDGLEMFHANAAAENALAKARSTAKRIKAARDKVESEPEPIKIAQSG